ncbi:DUF5132 domain-containing protein [Thermosynechococcus sp. HN-54]|uniref:DUF5132 domain-containing protein n=1 Tax=Thermosynechococcus sp. HN-54 TaxID=2933959 RepID=UPI00202CCE37|nr:DUF5132 domain-containing protein [Thermosynechococcus sp. HN-54]URR35349.1 DUF5132 domain-containing protein [Thermosynechococcus sp. HN-54]
MEFEALLLGLEPLTVLALGVGAVAVAPVVGAVDSMTGHNLAEQARNAAKSGLMWAFEAYEKAQTAVAEASESFQDLVAEARSEMMEQKAAKAAAPEEPREVTIS